MPACNNMTMLCESATALCSLFWPPDFEYKQVTDCRVSDLDWENRTTSLALGKNSLIIKRCPGGLTKREEGKRIDLHHCYSVMMRGLCWKWTFHTYLLLSPFSVVSSHQFSVNIFICFSSLLSHSDHTLVAAMYYWGSDRRNHCLVFNSLCLLKPFLLVAEGLDIQSGLVWVDLGVRLHSFPVSTCSRQACQVCWKKSGTSNMAETYFKSPFLRFHHLFGSYITLFGFKLIFIHNMTPLSTYFHFFLTFCWTGRVYSILLHGYSKSYLRGVRCECLDGEKWLIWSMYTWGVYIAYMSQLYGVTDVTDGGLRHTHLYRSGPQIICNIIQHQVA